MRILADEFADAELAAVPRFGELLDPGRTAREIGHPFTELLARSVARTQTFDDGVRRELAAFEREPHSRRINRIDEPPRVAHQHPAVAGRSLGGVRVFLDDIQAGDLFRAGQPLSHRRAIGHLGGENLIGSSAARLEEIIRIADDTDADDIIGQRNVPEPGAIGKRAEAHGHDAVLDHIAARTAKVAPDRRFAEIGIRLAELEAGAEQSCLAGCIDNDLAADDISTLSISSVRDGR
jgi:hypothetical protein